MVSNDVGLGSCDINPSPMTTDGKATPHGRGHLRVLSCQVSSGKLSRKPLL